MSILNHWPSGIRDTTEFPRVELQFNVGLREHLEAFCKMDGVGWTDYADQKEKGDIHKSDSRLRTYRKMYEKLGLIYKDNETLRLSRLGKQIATLENDLNELKEPTLNKLRETAIDILSRYQLRNPTEDDEIPESCDVLPSICIWKAMLILGSKLHPEEINRVILRIMKMSELDAAIEKIMSARKRFGSYAKQDPDALNEGLGIQVHTDQPEARIAPWFSFVGWGGLIIEQQGDSEGFRHLNEDSIPIITQILQDPPYYYNAKDKDDWLAYYIGSAAVTESSELHEMSEETTAREFKKITDIARSPRGTAFWPLNQIIYGAPGTGKTYSAIEYAMAIVENRPINMELLTPEQRRDLMNRYSESSENGRVVFTTFHQSYGYEEFIQGIRPDSISGNICFNKADGIFKKIADKALVDDENNYVIIIDEINRGNISKIFGELITLVEEDKRYGELNQLTVTLPLGEIFTVPNNLYIVGTMNSADKSISLIDTALRRRFAFVEMAPNEAIIENDVLRKLMAALNKYLKNELRSTDLLIGHSYFIGKSEDSLGDIMNQSIIPLLYEYFYDDEAKVKKALECLNETDYVINGDYRGRIRIQKKV